MKRRKTWREKLADNKGLPKVGRIEGKMSTKWGAGTMVIPAPAEVDELMRAVPKGKLVTIQEIREALSKKHKVDLACPLTTGIFSWIAAHAAAEAEAEGARRITPYWRTLKAGGELNPKFPGGIEGLKEKMALEGHSIVQRGTRWFVLDHARKLAQLDIADLDA